MDGCVEDTAQAVGAPLDRLNFKIGQQLLLQEEKRGRKQREGDKKDSNM